MVTTQQYVNAGTEIIVEQKGNRKFYKTDSEIVLDSVNACESEYAGEPCVQTAKGTATIFIQKKKLRTRIIVTDKDVTNLIGQLALIDYTVPSKGQSAGFSPVSQLFKSAVPVGESLWLVRASDIPTGFIEEMLDLGCVVNVTHTNEGDNVKLLARAINFLNDKIVSAIGSSNSVMEKAAEALVKEASQSNFDAEESAVRFLKRSKEAEGRLKKLQKDMQSGAAKIGIMDSAYEPQRLSVHAKKLRNEAAELAATYYKGEGGADTTPAVETASTELPVFSLTDLE